MAELSNCKQFRQLIKSVYKNAPTIANLDKLIRHFIKPKLFIVIWQIDRKWTNIERSVWFANYPDKIEIAFGFDLDVNNIEIIDFDDVIIVFDKSTDITAIYECQDDVYTYVRYLNISARNDENIKNHKDVISKLKKHVILPIMSLLEHENKSTLNDIATSVADIVEISKLKYDTIKADDDCDMREILKSVIENVTNEHNVTKQIILTFSMSVPNLLVGNKIKIQTMLHGFITNVILSVCAQKKETIYKAENFSQIDDADKFEIIIDAYEFLAENIINHSITLMIPEKRQKNELDAEFESDIGTVLSCAILDAIGGTYTLREGYLMLNMTFVADKTIPYNTMKFIQQKHVLLINGDDKKATKEWTTELDALHVKYTIAHSPLEAQILYTDVFFDIYISDGWNRGAWLKFANFDRKLLLDKLKS